jgi:hypothetical protein
MGKRLSGLTAPVHAHPDPASPCRFALSMRGVETSRLLPAGLRNVPARRLGQLPRLRYAEAGLELAPEVTREIGVGGEELLKRLLRQHH